MKKKVNTEKVSSPKDSARKNTKPLDKLRLKLKKDPGAIICLALMIVMAVAALLLFRNVISKGAEAVSDSYKSAFASERDVAYQARYQKYYDAAEAANHVTNRAAIHIGNIQETEKLEVLKVSDVEFILEDSDDNSENITSWLEVPGEGTFVVDLQAAEFIVDNERSHVLVRLPYPELTNVKIDYPNANNILFKDDIFNGSYKDGENLAQKQLVEADLLIKKEFTSNERFYLNAQESAIATVEYLIRQLNPAVTDLSIDIEFY